MSTHTIAPDPEVNVGPDSVPDPFTPKVRNEMTEQKIAPVLTLEEVFSLIGKHLWLDKEIQQIEGDSALVRAVEQAVLARVGAARDQEPLDKGEISDGYHTFNELYAHRVRLFSTLMRLMPESSWWSRAHEDGSVWEGWILAGIDTPAGTATYHLPVSEIEHLPEGTGRHFGKAWDGHTSADVLDRLLSIRALKGTPAAAVADREESDDLEDAAIRSAESKGLLPCPFCGSKNVDARGWTSTDTSGPACDDCGGAAGCATESVQQNIAAWNRRASPAAAVADKQVVAWMADDGRTANAESRAGMHAITQASYCIPLVRAQAQLSGNPGQVADIEELIDRLLDAQQDINLAANETMSQPLCSASALIDEIERVLRSVAAQAQPSGNAGELEPRPIVVTRTSDHTVMLAFSSCREASVYERAAIAASKEGASHE